ncbi:hypothetical protein F511_23635 [Dorcoceras hygrometricum]|uniref:Uncharacterized protein n=1 Tax=Dorcoceras hygrometricum TaxID=472368 RepID=A0A2Z7AIF1_9LAMI|nr:hypothetical protein F511_23635 [Dorcoceras hygrometricum]
MVSLGARSYTPSFPGLDVSLKDEIWLVVKSEVHVGQHVITSMRSVVAGERCYVVSLSGSDIVFFVRWRGVARFSDLSSRDPVCGNRCTENVSQVTQLVVELTQLEVPQEVDRVSQLAYSIYVLVLIARGCPVLVGLCYPL